MTGPSDTTMLGVFLSRAGQTPDRVAIEELAVGGAPADLSLTWAQWREASRAFAAALVADGVQVGDRVAILADNRVLWPIADVGILMAGAVSVGIYPTSAPAQIRDLLADSGSVAIVVDTAERVAVVRSVVEGLTTLRRVVADDWHDYLALGATALADSSAVAVAVDARTAGARPDDLALLIYTSGSTGEPKGARITHRYLSASAESVRDTLGLVDDDSSLSFLPYCHAGERVFGLYTRILCGMRTGHVVHHGRLWEAARQFQPTIFGGLPRFFEKLYEALIVHEGTLDPVARQAWQYAMELGRERFQHRRAGRRVPSDLQASWQAAIRPATELLGGLLGGRVRLATSGGATLPSEVADYLDAVGMTVLGAYGQTEHLCVAFHRPDAYDTDTVGPPMPGTEIRIDADGEVLLRRGALTFAGYHGKPDDTRDAFTADGEWLRTGDLGEMTASGRLRLTGRKKELIALSSGKKVAPLPIESRLIEDPWIGHAMLYGEGERFVSALLVPRRRVLEAWQREHGLSVEYCELLQHPEVVSRVQQAVDRVNAALSGPERIKRFVLLERELSVEADELTPTMKIRRAVVADRYRDRLEPLYR
ncbi:MAG TPA: long-chain fatty acid--CoA ligase [Gemmatimonadaceae bacterium]|nr:long-chain fatty acid--CoA ligase [Gemmatimonadaceae bacterium]